MEDSVTASIVTYNSSRVVARAIRHLLDQSHPPAEILIWDNASEDPTLEKLRGFSSPLIDLHVSPVNVGFCAAHNRNIARSRGKYVLVLNPDCFLEKDCIAACVQAFKRFRNVGSIAPKLYRCEEQGNAVTMNGRPLLDSTGIYVTPSQRHFDRGSNEADDGQYERAEYVFGATGAAAFYRRAMLDDLEIFNQYFDEDFFAYREDADLAWRAQWAGWKCLYWPSAVGFHVRQVFPDRRADVPPEINRHSVKNRFLMRANNLDARNALRFFGPVLWRDLQVLGYVMLKERSSLPAFLYLWKHRKKILQKRQLLKAKRRVEASSIGQWFSNRPVSFPAAS